MSDSIYKILIAVIIGLLVLCLFYIDRLRNEKMQSLAYSAGASQRFNTELTASNQRPYDIPRVDQVKDAGKMEYPQKSISEDFANLDKYTKQEEVLASYLYKEDSKEMFTSPATLVQGELSRIADEQRY